ncbi:putative Acyl carrier protein, mitochondrial [Hypsibius exemplaris]|uniref:Acyl carrier protein n=1 Tax=Hypsibius exemplaris TaxID=2072580 RepID=A0A1W0WBE8_HYPEX|nr:putative Acyl carrier protein, mitochondrial [Hypsibius exemplaris]
MRAQPCTQCSLHKQSPYKKFPRRQPKQFLFFHFTPPSRNVALEFELTTRKRERLRNWGGTSPPQLESHFPAMASRILPSLRGLRNASQFFTPGKNATRPTASLYPMQNSRKLHTSQSVSNSTLPLCLNGNGRGLLMPLQKSVTWQAKRWMSAPAMTKKFIRQCVILNLQLFDKIDPEKLTLDSHFHNDLGLDSLDHVEIIMAIEDEFCFEIPDMDAQRLLTPRQIAQYVCDKQEIYDEDEDHHGHPAEHHEVEDPWQKEKQRGAFQPPAPAHH